MVSHDCVSQCNYTMSKCGHARKKINRPSCLWSEYTYTHTVNRVCTRRDSVFGSCKVMQLIAH